MEKRRFHELLEAHLRASGYTNYEFARITGINRVNIQRYLAGTRLPDPQIFEAIRRELRLGVREHRELQEAYYRRRREIYAGWRPDLKRLRNLRDRSALRECVP